MSGFDSLVWDKAAGRALLPVAMFVSEEALRGAIRPGFCAALDKARAARRGVPVDPKATDSFNTCPDPLKSTVILGSAGGAGFDRIGVLVPPYEAGAYAEGSYEITLPVTRAVHGAVAAPYRSAFVPPR